MTMLFPPIETTALMTDLLTGHAPVAVGVSGVMSFSRRYREMTKRMQPSKFCQVCGDPVPTARHKTVCGKEACKQENQRRTSQRYERKQKVNNRSAGTPTIACEICQENLEWLAPAHLHMHGLTLAQYRLQYPDSPTIAQRVLQSRSTNAAKRAHHLRYLGKEPDGQLYEFLTGTLLGDGSLEKVKASARYAEGGSNKDYLQWKYTFLEQYFHCTWRERTSSPHIKTGKQYRGWWIRTATHPLLTQWHDQWYQSQKAVPKALVEENLTAYALAVWFCDDGSVSSHGTASLYTMAFTLEENIWLSQVISNKFELRAKVLLESHTHLPFLFFTNSERQKLQAIIAPFCIPGMEYKYQRQRGEEHES